MLKTANIILPGLVTKHRRTPLTCVSEIVLKFGDKESFQLTSMHLEWWNLENNIQTFVHTQPEITIYGMMTLTGFMSNEDDDDDDDEIFEYIRMIKYKPSNITQ